MGGLRILFSKDSTEGFEGEGGVTGAAANKKETVPQATGIDYDNEKLREETTEEIAAQWAD